MELNSDHLRVRDGSQSWGKWSPAAAAAGGRLTRSRARELGLKLEIAASPELGGRRGKKLQRQTEPLPIKRNLEKQIAASPELGGRKGGERKRRTDPLPIKGNLEKQLAASTELGGRRGEKRQHRTEPRPIKGNLEKQEDEKECTQKPKSTAAGRGGGSIVSTITDPPSEPRSNTISHTSNLLTLRRQLECRTSNLLTLRRQLECRSNSQASAVKNLVAEAPWLVHVSSTSLDGKEIFRYSGIVIQCDKEKTWILTSYRVVFCPLNGSLYDPLPKLAVHVPKATHLPNNGIYEGNMVFFNEHYRLALLEIEGEMNFEMENAPYGGNPSYGDVVSALARDENLSLKLCSGTIKFLEEDHFMFPNYKLYPCGIGGPVINHAGDIVGMSCDDDGRDPVILRITTIHNCIEMWKFGRILRPVLGMCFRTVELLDLGLQDCLHSKYGVNNGFIVDEVIINSAAERRGIRRGDVITSFHGRSGYLPELEDFLLSIGMDALEGLKHVDDFKLEVHNILQDTKRTICLPVQFSDGSEY